MAQMSFRIDDMSKLQFEKLCEDLEINPTIAFTMFIKKMIREQRIPFDVSIYSRETLLALEETRLKKNLSAEFNDVDSLFSSLDEKNKITKHNQKIDTMGYMVQIEEYLTLLDLIMKIDNEFLPDVNQKCTITVITQPGMRYAQAKAIVSNLLLDAKFNELSALERQRILERLLSEIRGRMMEEIILLETKIANPEKKVFKLQFAIGEFDMVVFDPKALNCKIYEVKYSKEQVPEQCRHLKDKEKCALTRHRYGEIIGKYVIYRGISSTLDDIQYINVEEYLKDL